MVPIYMDMDMCSLVIRAAQMQTSARYYHAPTRTAKMEKHQVNQGAWCMEQLVEMLTNITIFKNFCIILSISESTSRFCSAEIHTGVHRKMMS